MPSLPVISLPGGPCHVDTYASSFAATKHEAYPPHNKLLAMSGDGQTVQTYLPSDAARYKVFYCQQPEGFRR